MARARYAADEELRKRRAASAVVNRDKIYEKARLWALRNPEKMREMRERAQLKHNAKMAAVNALLSLAQERGVYHV